MPETCASTPSIAPALRVTDLHVDAADRPLVRGVTLEVAPGEIVALVGESGSGKSLTGSAAIGLLPRGLVARGSVRIGGAGHDNDGGDHGGGDHGGAEIVGLDESRLRRLRGAGVAMVFQEPQTALNPSRRVGAQIRDALRAHRRVGRAQAREIAIRLLTEVGIDDPERRIRAYPHQLSGGQRQRVVIALALTGEPRTIVADEPTTALDVTVQAGILRLFRRLCAERSVGILLITHDMGVVAQTADRVAVMHDGRIVESGNTASVLRSPRDAYTRRLLAAVPSVDVPELPAADAAGRTSLVEVRDLVVRYPDSTGRPDALRGVSLSIGRGEVLGVVGESGSGKSTLGRAVLGLVDPHQGSVTRRAERTALIHQDPFSSLDPRWTVRRSIAEPMRLRGDDATAIRRRVDELLEAVRLPQTVGDSRPATLSGGQRQRVALARALSCDPELVVADEPTSALDVAVQAAVLELFADLRTQIGFAALVITHDLALVARIADRIAVLKSGAVVEIDTAAQVLDSPREPYTQSLIDAVPRVPDARDGTAP